MTRYTYATPRPVPDVSPRRARYGAPPDRGAPYRMAHPEMAHPIRPEPLPERHYNSRKAMHLDLLAIAVIVLVVLAASLTGVRLP